MEKYECFAGETKSLVLTIENEQENSNVDVAFVHGHHEIRKSFSTKDGTLYKGEDGNYYCELSSEDTISMGLSDFTIEIKVEAPGGVTIRPIGILEIKKNKVHQL